jgi:cytochrome c biogenesis protein CcmG/thiol:disulfide interchange protein DsbE
VKNSILFLLLVVVAVTGLLFSGKYMSKGSAAAPDFTLPVLGEKGKTVQLSSLKGKAVLVNFWATWCEPCKVEMPWLVELQKKYGPQGLQILGVAQDDSGEEQIMAFSRKMGLNYPILQGNNQMSDLYPSQGLPLSVYVDRNGKVVQRVVGLVSESVMEDAIKQALGQGGSGDSTKSTASAQ